MSKKPKLHFVYALKTAWLVFAIMGGFMLFGFKERHGVNQDQAVMVVLVVVGSMSVFAFMISLFRGPDARKGG